MAPRLKSTILTWRHRPQLTAIDFFHTQKSLMIMISTTRRNFLQKELISFDRDEALSSFKVEELANVMTPP